MTTWTIALPPGYRPHRTWPLFRCGANARMHHLHRAKITKQIRGDVKRLARNATPITEPVAVLAVQHPDLIGRPCDADNIAPIVKAAIDGLRDAGVLADDSPEFVTEVRYTVGPRRAGSQLVLHLSTADPESDAA